MSLPKLSGNFPTELGEDRLSSGVETFDQDPEEVALPSWVPVGPDGAQRLLRDARGVDG